MGAYYVLFQKVFYASWQQTDMIFYLILFIHQFTVINMLKGSKSGGGGARGALAPQFLTFARRCFARRIGCFVASRASPPNHIFFIPPPLNIGMIILLQKIYVDNEQLLTNVCYCHVQKHAETVSNVAIAQALATPTCKSQLKTKLHFY